ncbi:MAG: hypothetical protein Q9M09_02545 [Mariprofundaceae bacterium]|nr:hypothetical protein [Mariprofundaceae bacterium]
MPIPFILGGIALAAAVTGIKKGFDAKSKNKEAETIVRKSQRRFQEAEENLKTEGNVLNQNLEDFAEAKLVVFTTQIKNLVDLLNKCKNTSSNFEHQSIQLTAEEVKHFCL